MDFRQLGYLFIWCAFNLGKERCKGKLLMYKFIKLHFSILKVGMRCMKFQVKGLYAIPETHCNQLTHMVDCK